MLIYYYSFIDEYYYTSPFEPNFSICVHPRSQRGAYSTDWTWKSPILCSYSVNLFVTLVCYDSKLVWKTHNPSLPSYWKADPYLISTYYLVPYFQQKRREMTSVDCLFLSDGDDFRLLDYMIACVRHYHSLLKESNITDDVVLSYGKDIVVNEGSHLFTPDSLTWSLAYSFNLSFSRRSCACTSYNYQILRGPDTIERL